MIPMNGTEGSRKPDIVGFALGILEESESLEAKVQIEQDATCQVLLKRTKRLLSPLEADRKPLAAPSGLAQKALSRIRAAQVEAAVEADLAGLAIKALEESEKSRAEEEIENNPLAKKMWTRFTRVVRVLHSERKPIRAPGGLARKTILHVRSSITRTMPAAPPLNREYDPGARRTWGLRTDLMAAAGLLIMFGGVIWPALHRQRQTQKDLECQYNLAQIWRGLTTYASYNKSQYPKPDLSGPRSFAGVYAPVLKDSGHILPETIHLDCPSEIAAYPKRDILSLKKLDELYARDREQWKAATDEVGGTYSYSMGHVAKGQLVGFDQRTGLDNRPLMADSGHDRACHNSPNHSGRGQNVLFGGGHVRFRMDRKAGPGGDDIFLSQDYCKKAGLNKNDCVLGNSGDRPAGDLVSD
jgi:hypothetical protein